MFQNTYALVQTLLSVADINVSANTSQIEKLKPPVSSVNFEELFAQPSALTSSAKIHPHTNTPAYFLVTLKHFEKNPFFTQSTDIDPKTGVRLVTLKDYNEIFSYMIKMDRYTNLPRLQNRLTYLAERKMPSDGDLVSFYQHLLFNRHDKARQMFCQQEGFADRVSAFEDEFKPKRVRQQTSRATSTNVPLSLLR
jgi:hypothetical protein